MRLSLLLVVELTSLKQQGAGTRQLELLRPRRARKVPYNVKSITHCQWHQPELNDGPRMHWQPA